MKEEIEQLISGDLTMKHLSMRGMTTMRIFEKMVATLDKYARTGE